MPDNVAYFHAAYAATIALLIGYAVSIVVRRRRVAQRRAQRATAGGRGA